MTGDGYLWIATNSITDLFHSINSSMTSSLKGIIGVKSYFPENKAEFQDFRKRFRHKFRSDYPAAEEHDEPGVFAVQGYNAVKLLNTKSPLNIDPETRVEIVSVIGKGYHIVYWTDNLGFSETVENDINGEANSYPNSMDEVQKALWPVKPRKLRRRNLQENRMRVLLPGNSLFKQFVNVEFDPAKNHTKFTGFAVAVFHEIMTKMNQPYDRTAFNGSYDELIETLGLKKFDAVVGDIMITSRYEFAEFTQPFTESGLEMIVRVRSRLSNETWLFMKPFTTEMWWLIAAINNGFVIWLIERNHCEELQGSIINQAGIIIWLSFTALFTLHGDKLHSNLTRISVGMWLFVALIITQSYMASLASMLTAQRLEPAITNVAMLKNMNTAVGVCNGTFIDYYLMTVLGFKNDKIISYNTNKQYADALNKGEISAIFLEILAAKLFLGQYCCNFIRTGETFKVGGFGFAFQRGFSRLSEANMALMNISESGKLKQLEDTFLGPEKCVEQESSSDEDKSLSTRSFRVLFQLTLGTSTISLFIYIFISIIEYRKRQKMVKTLPVSTTGTENDPVQPEPEPSHLY